MNQNSNYTPHRRSRRSERVHPISGASLYRLAESGLAVGDPVGARSGLDRRAGRGMLDAVGWTCGPAHGPRSGLNPRGSNHGGYTPTPSLSLVRS